MSELDQDSSFDLKTFMANFQGMEDLAFDMVKNAFLTVPPLVGQIEEAVRTRDPQKLELSAHTLKGVLSNFYAEPSKHLAWRLEQMGHGQTMSDAPQAFEELKEKLRILMLDLTALLEKGGRE